MDTLQIGLGFERRIGYSILGLFAGDIAMLLLLSLITKSWQQDPSYFLRAFTFCVNCSLVGWVAIGIPSVVLINTNFVAKLNRWLVPLIGVSLGSVALLMIYLIIGHLPAGQLGGLAYYWMFAAVVSGIAFIVYCALVRRAVRQQKEKSNLIIEAPLDIFKSAAPSKPEAPLDIFRSPPGDDAAKPEPPLDIYKSN